MGYFSRKKQAEKAVNPGSDKHVEGIVRRGLTESDDKLQSAAVRRDGREAGLQSL